MANVAFHVVPVRVSTKAPGLASMIAPTATHWETCGHEIPRRDE
jgi:hypothetical protein